MEPKSWQELNQRIIECRKCARLVSWREEVARRRKRAYQNEEYWGKPVPGFGDTQAKVLVVGLAPGAHGANRTGRMFTGDGSGDFLYRALFTAGFANQSISRRREDGLKLNELYISAVCRCAPPQNRPAPDEIANCLPYLEMEIDHLASLQVVVALGRIAFDGLLRLFRQKGFAWERSGVQRLDAVVLERSEAKTPKEIQLLLEPGELVFAHGVVFRLEEHLPWLVASYHPSRQNTQTGRLSETMFASIWSTVRQLILPDSQANG